jgi:hypothetical protein
VYESSNQALLGSPNVACEQANVGHSLVKQVVDLTGVPDAAEVTLYFDYVLWSEDKVSGDDYDHFGVYINGDRILRSGYDGNEPFGCGKWSWKLGSIVLPIPSRYYDGQSITLLLGNYTRLDNWYNTYTYVDNVRIVVE